MPLDTTPSDQPVLTTRAGLSIPRLGFGTWQLDDATARAMVAEALDAGADRAPLSNLQVEYHPFHTQDGLRAWCCDRDWAFTAYSPLAQGDVSEDDTLREIAEAHDAHPVEVTIAWLLHLPGVVAIPRTSDADHLRSNWAARRIELDESEVGRISALDRGHRTVDPDFAPWR